MQLQPPTDPLRAHHQAWNRTCEAAASAPGTLAWLGDTVGPIGGITVSSAIGLYASASVHTVGKSTQHFSINVKAMGNFPHDKSQALVEAVIEAMSSKQMLPRELPSLSVTVTNDIPVEENLGAEIALAAAAALALHCIIYPDEELPPEATLAELATTACSIVPAGAGQWWRAITALRAHEDCVHSVVHSDESFVPLRLEDERETLTPAVIFSTATSADQAQRATVLDSIDRDDAFVRAACSAFGVATLKELSQAPTRVLDWLGVMLRNKPEGLPDLEQATKWLQLCGRDSARARTASTDLKSRHGASISRLIGQSSEELDTLVEFCTPTQRRILQSPAAHRGAGARAIPGAETAVLVAQSPEEPEGETAVLSARPVGGAHLLSVD